MPGAFRPAPSLGTTRLLLLRWALVLATGCAFGSAQCIPSCGANAECAEPTGTCVCAANYYGDGVLCERSTCTASAVSRPEGVLVFGNTDAGSVAVAPCPTGYAGIAERLCRGVPNAMHGEWDDAAVACAPIQCAAQTAFNASFPASYLGETAGACLPGFRGTISRQCLLNIMTNTGYWTTPSGSCVQITCPASTWAFSEWPEFAPNGVAQAVTGTCVLGYVATDPDALPQRQCNPDGTYSIDVVNPCTRNWCPGETFLDAVWPQIPVEEVAFGSCVPGYEGSPWRLCTVSGAWSSSVSSACSRKLCLATVSGGMAWAATLAGEVATGSCEAGHREDLSGPPTRSCQLSGEWASAVTRPCQRINCSALADDGAASWPQTASGETAHGSCNAGWAGAPYRTCDLAGAFGAIQNPCVQNRCSAVIHANASFANALSGTAHNAGTCLVGFAGAIARDCDLSGTWTAVTGTCARLFCPAVDGTTDPALWAAFPETAAGSVAVGACASGWDGRPQRQCFANGTWAATVLSNSCTTDRCPPLSDDTNADWPAGVPGQSATGQCRPGYHGTPVRECLHEGWGEPTATCSRSTCPAQTESHAVFAESFAGQTNVLGACEPGWTGAPVRNCGLAGAWSDDAASIPCTQLFCNSTADSTGAFERTAAGSTATGTCPTGRLGALQRSCSFAGEWLPPVDSCAELPAASCPPYDDGVAVFPETPVGTAAVEGACNPGYYDSIVGVKSTRDCQPDSRWGPVVNECLRTRCSSSVAGFASFQETYGGETATGACEPGYGDGGTPPTRTCQLPGFWGAMSHDCVPLLCPSGDTAFQATWPKSIPAGTTGVPGDCNAGYLGAPLRDCLITGEWSMQIAGTACVQTFCPALTEGYANWPVTPTGAVPVGVTLTTCLPTYTFFGDGTSRDCNPDGTWGAIFNACYPIYCPAATFGSAQWPSTRAGQIAVGTCDTGYEGFPVCECDANGEWQRGTISSPCERAIADCPQELHDNAAWPETGPGDTGSGICIFGFMSASPLGPSRPCLLNPETNTTTWGPVFVRCAMICPAGWRGDACDQCDEGRYGPICEPCSTSCINGTCYEGTAGNCTCFLGWAGPTCEDCAAGQYGADCAACAGCNLHGTCHEGIGGNCTCFVGWTGSSCAACAPGHFGPECTGCELCAHGTCHEGLGGKCTCDVGWAGSSCAACAPGHFGPECTACTLCSEHGECVEGHDGNCTCAGGWAGAECTECAAGHFGNMCQACTLCIHGTCTPGRAGACTCDASWAGPLCDKCPEGNDGADCLAASVAATGSNGAVVTGAAVGATVGVLAIAVVVIAFIFLHRRRERLSKAAQDRLHELQSMEIPAELSKDRFATSTPSWYYSAAYSGDAPDIGDVGVFVRLDDQLIDGAQIGRCPSGRYPAVLRVSSVEKLGDSTVGRDAATEVAIPIGPSESSAFNDLLAYLENAERNAL